jgi:uncharacterized Ntn-hydrolase superfamily protein
MINPILGPAGLDLLADGIDANTALHRLVANDAGSAARQLHLIDAHGHTAGHTGGECIDWCGHECHDGVSVAGNMLTGPQVLAETLKTYTNMASLPFAERLLTALIAGDVAGGDKRGRQAAALLVFNGEVYPDVSIRVDDHPDALNELRRVYDVSLGDFAIFKTFMPTDANPAGITDRSKLEAARQAAGKKSKGGA